MLETYAFKEGKMIGVLERAHPHYVEISHFDKSEQSLMAGFNYAAIGTRRPQKGVKRIAVLSAEIAFPCRLGQPSSNRP